MKSVLFLWMLFSTYNKNVVNVPSQMIDSVNVQNIKQITTAYNTIDFEGNPVSFEAFSIAFEGYNNIRQQDSSLISADTNKQILTICDLSLSSNERRLWVVDLFHEKVLMNTLVAHGQGTGEEYAAAFSNNDNSHQTSLGFYITQNVYTGSHGNSLKLIGVDTGFNDRAFDRSIVLHGADYVSEGFIKSNKYLGRSWGCPAVPLDQVNEMVNYLCGGTCLFIYYPSGNYFTNSKWVNPYIVSYAEMLNGHQPAG